MINCIKSIFSDHSILPHIFLINSILLYIHSVTSDNVSSFDMPYLKPCIDLFLCYISPESYLNDI